MSSTGITQERLQVILTGNSTDDWRSNATYINLSTPQQVTFAPFTDHDMFSEYASQLYPRLSSQQFHKCAFIVGFYLAGDHKNIDHIHPLMFLLAANMRTHNMDESKITNLFSFALTDDQNSCKFIINGKNYKDYIDSTYEEMKGATLSVITMKDLMEPLVIDEKNDKRVAQLSWKEDDSEASHMARWIHFLDIIRISINSQTNKTSFKYSNYIAVLAYSMYQGLWKDKIGVQQAIVNSLRSHLSKFLDLSASDFPGLVVNSRSIATSCSLLYDRSYEGKVLIAISYFATLISDLKSTFIYVQEVKYMLRVMKAALLIRAEYFGMGLLKTFMIVYDRSKIPLGDLINAVSIGPFERIMSSWYHTIDSITKEYKLLNMLTSTSSPWCGAKSTSNLDISQVAIAKPMGWIFARLFDTTRMGQFRPNEAPQLYLAMSQVALKLDATLDIDDAYAYKRYSQQDMTIAGLIREALLKIINDISMVSKVNSGQYQLPLVTQQMIAHVNTMQEEIRRNPAVQDQISEFTANKKRGRTVARPSTIRTVHTHDSDPENNAEMSEEDEEEYVTRLISQEEEDAKIQATIQRAVAAEAARMKTLSNTPAVEIPPPKEPELEDPEDDNDPPMIIPAKRN